MKRFIYQIKRVKIRDLIQIWKLPIALVCAVIWRHFHKDLWIISEDKGEARDNGYWFYKHVKEKHPEQECVYAISGVSPDLYKIQALGDWVEYGSLKHWILYLASSKKISSQKAGNPNAAIFYFLEVYGFLKDNRIFLQHGVIINDLKWLYYDVTKINRFICGAYPEYKFICKAFGYPKNNVVYTGLCRFDGLHEEVKVQKRLIVIMPTWREWIADEDYRLLKYEGTTDITKTNYFVKWSGLITDPRIKELQKKHECKFIFFPHREMQKYINCFPNCGDVVEIADAKKYDVQKLLKNASMMITDYSSVFIDMLYMKKPVLFYQFDYDKFREAQYGEGYFSYKNNPFAKSCQEKEALIDALEKIIISDFQVSEQYLAAHRDFFRLYDTKNCERVYKTVKKA